MRAEYFNNMIISRASKARAGHFKVFLSARHGGFHLNGSKKNSGLASSAIPSIIATCQKVENKFFDGLQP